MKPTTLLVRARLEGVPVPKRRTRIKICKKTGRDLTMVYHDAPEEVPNDSFTRRSIRRGDLEIVKSKPAAVKAKV